MNKKEFCAACASRSRFLDVYSFLKTRITKSQVAILMYHRVSTREDSWSLESLNVHSFERQIEYFCRNFEIISVEKLAQCFTQEKCLPQKAVVITFDDGYKDTFLYAYPILKKYHVPATIFLSTGYIGATELFWWDKVGYMVWNTPGNSLDVAELGTYSLQNEFEKLQTISTITERLKKLPEEEKCLLIQKLHSMSCVDIPTELAPKMILSWDDIKQMNKGGIDFGAHTVTHPILTNMPFEQAKNEIIKSKKDIETRLGKEILAFSYPNGDLNIELAKYIKQIGFRLAVSVFPRKFINLNDNIYALGRIGTGDNFDEFKVIFSGMWGDLQNMLGRGG